MWIAFSASAQKLVNSLRKTQFHETWFILSLGCHNKKYTNVWKIWPNCAMRITEMGGVVVVDVRNYIIHIQNSLTPQTKRGMRGNFLKPHSHEWVDYSFIHRINFFGGGYFFLNKKYTNVRKIWPNGAIRITEKGGVVTWWVILTWGPRCLSFDV